MTINEYCKTHKITQGELSKRLNISQTYISKLKYHQIQPNAYIKEELTKLGINVSGESTNASNSKKNEIINRLQKENDMLKAQIENIKAKKKDITKVLLLDIDSLAETLKNYVLYEMSILGKGGDE